MSGYIKPLDDPKLYQLGASPLPQIELEPTGDWTKYAPKFEPQRKRFETSNCVSFNTLDCIQRLMQRLGVAENFSDRWVGIMAGTTPQGNSPTIVAEAIRKNGLVPEEMMPFSDDLESVEDYYSWDKNKDDECVKEGKRWLSKWDFGYEQVPTNPESMMTALKFSPLGCAVYAWQEKDGLYVSDMPANHWTCVVVGFEKDKYWLVDDSYMQDGTNLKKLAWNFKFDFCLRYHIDKKKLEEQLTIMQQLLNLIQKVISIIMNEPKPIIVEPTPEPIVEPAVAPVAPPKYDWSTPMACRHSVRVICDEEGLSVAMKNQLCETVRFESGFNPKAININKDKSKDCGLCQLNERWYLKTNNMTCQQAIDDPARCVKIMARAFKVGRARDWIAFRKLYPTMAKKYGALSSSVNPQNLSLTIKGLIPLIVFTGGLFGLQITNTELETLIDVFVVIVSAGITGYGLLRKIFYKKPTDTGIDAY